jgi:serine/threonine-protein phosphatase CPPED1
MITAYRLASMEHLGKTRGSAAAVLFWNWHLRHFLLSGDLPCEPFPRNPLDLILPMTRASRTMRPTQKQRWEQFNWICARLAVLVFMVVALPGCRHQSTGLALQSFDFVQMCDPQFGFGEYVADLGRFEQATKQINALRPDLVVVCGDLVNSPDEKSFDDFNHAKAQLTVPCYVAPGNHDLGNEPTIQSLSQYRKLIGKDYYTVDHKECVFVMVNSQLWKTPVAGETEKQDRWLLPTLESAAKKQKRVFIVMHHPLFVKEAEEPDNYFNLPLGKRRELLACFERFGVVAVLAGHTHATATHEYHGIQFVNSETTSRNLDKRPYGFRVWHVVPQRPYRNEFVPLAVQ